MDKSIGTQLPSKAKITDLLLSVPAPGTGQHWVSDSAWSLLCSPVALRRLRALLYSQHAKTGSTIS